MKYKIWIKNDDIMAMDKVFEKAYGIKRFKISSSQSLVRLQEGYKYETYATYQDENNDLITRTFDVKCIEVEIDDFGIELAKIQIDEYTEI